MGGPVRRAARRHAWVARHAVCSAAVLLLLLFSEARAQSGSWTSVAYVNGGVCEAWGEGAAGTACEGTHYFSSFEEQGGALDLEFVDFSPGGNCQTTSVAFSLLGAFAGNIDQASYFMDVRLNGQFAASVPLNPSTFRSDSCELLEEIPVEAVAVDPATYSNAGVNSLSVTPSELDVAAARFCAVEVTGQYLCSTPPCRECDEDGQCHISDRPGCCSSNEECADDLEGSVTENCVLPHCDGPTNQCMNVWICTDASVAELQPCETVQQCDDVTSYCADVSCEETCVTEAILPLQPGCCNVASDCTPAVCAVAACDYVRHICVYKPLSGCATPTATPSASRSNTPSMTASETPTPTKTPTPSVSPTSSPTSTTTASTTISATPTPTATTSETRTPAASPSASTIVESPAEASDESSVPDNSDSVHEPTDPGDKESGSHWFLIIMGIILAAGVLTLVAMVGAGYGYYRYRQRATFIYPEDYIEDEEFPM